MSDATTSLIPELQRIRLEDFVHWISSDSGLPREFVFDLAIKDLGDRRLRRALALIEAGARLPLNALGRIVSLYLGGIKRIDKGYVPATGAANLARKLLADPEIPKFAVGPKPAKGTLSKMAEIWRPLRKYQGDDAREIYLTLRHWAMTAPESYTLAGMRAVDLITAFNLDPFLAADLMRVIVLRLRVTAKFARTEPVVVRAKSFLSKDLRDVRG